MWCGIRAGSRSVAASARVPALISGRAKVAVSRGVDQVGGQRQLEPAAHSHPVDHGEHRLVQPGQQLQSAEAAHAVVAVHRIARGGRPQIPAGAEELLAAGAQHGDP
jgi:hypothetical protein